MLAKRKIIGLVASLVLVVTLIAASLGYLAIQRAGGSSATTWSPSNSTTTISGSAALHPSVSIQVAGNGTYRIHVHETGLAITYNITAANLWKYPHDSLNPFNTCDLQFPIGLAVLQGYYDERNFTQGKALALYNTGIAYLCTAKLYPVAYYVFSPSSSSAQAFDSRGDSLGNDSMSINLLSSGYWTGGYGAGSSGPAQFQPFRGTYTIVAADEWGAVAISHFSITPPP